MLAGEADRIIWAGGVPVIHLQPFLEAFWNFQMCEELQEGYACPLLTDDIQRMMLGDTLARRAGLHIPGMTAKMKGDEFDRLDKLRALDQRKGASADVAQPHRIYPGRGHRPL